MLWYSLYVKMRDIRDVVLLIETVLPSVVNACMEVVLCGIHHSVVRSENENSVENYIFYLKERGIHTENYRTLTINCCWFVGPQVRCWLHILPRLKADIIWPCTSLKLKQTLDPNLIDILGHTPRWCILWSHLLFRKLLKEFLPILLRQ